MVVFIHPHRISLRLVAWELPFAPGIFSPARFGSLLSFAAITDEPPPEVAAAGHDRCVVPIRPENIDDGLDAGRSDLGRLYAIIEDRQRPYYEHPMAA